MKYDIDSPPEKPSELILMALEDLEAVEKNPAYQVNMGEWHIKFGENSPCKVCFAGSVMASRLEVSLDSEVDPSDFPSPWAEMLRALNCLRVGSPKLASEIWKLCSGVSDRHVTDYGSPEAFKDDMLQLAADYQAIGK